MGTLSDWNFRGSQTHSVLPCSREPTMSETMHWLASAVQRNIEFLFVSMPCWLQTFLRALGGHHSYTITHPHPSQLTEIGRSSAGLTKQLRIWQALARCGSDNFLLHLLRRSRTLRAPTLQRSREII